MILAASATEHSRWHMLAPLCIAVLVKESFKLCHFLRRFQTNVEISENRGTGVPQKHPTNHPFSSINHFGQPPHQPFSSILLGCSSINQPAVGDFSFLEPPHVEAEVLKKTLPPATAPYNCWKKNNVFFLYIFLFSLKPIH